VHFGLGADPRIQSVRVEWPNGSEEHWENIRGNRIVTLRKNSGRPLRDPRLTPAGR
jgi:hypothetical protein